MRATISKSARTRRSVPRYPAARMRRFDDVDHDGFELRTTCPIGLSFTPSRSPVRPTKPGACSPSAIQTTHACASQRSRRTSRPTACATPAAGPSGWPTCSESIAPRLVDGNRPALAAVVTLLFEDLRPETKPSAGGCGSWSTTGPATSPKGATRSAATSRACSTTPTIGPAAAAPGASPRRRRWCRPKPPPQDRRASTLRRRPSRRTRPPPEVRRGRRARRRRGEDRRPLRQRTEATRREDLSATRARRADSSRAVGEPTPLSGRTDTDFSSFNLRGAAFAVGVRADHAHPANSQEAPLLLRHHRAPRPRNRGHGARQPTGALRPRRRDDQPRLPAARPDRSLRLRPPARREAQRKSGASC